MLSRTRIASAAAVAALSAAALAAAPPASAIAVDPSAFGITASGPDALPAQPSVNWTSGPSLAAASPGANSGTLRVGPMAVAAGDGFAAARVAGLRYADTVTVSALTATCSGGRTAVTVTGTVNGQALRPGERVALPGGYAAVGQTATNKDGSVTVTGLTVVDGSETVHAAVARC